MLAAAFRPDLGGCCCTLRQVEAFLSSLTSPHGGRLAFLAVMAYAWPAGSIIISGEETREGCTRWGVAPSCCVPLRGDVRLGGGRI